MGNTNTNMHKAKEAEANEFYTELSEIHAELNHYADKFQGKTVYFEPPTTKVVGFHQGSALMENHI